MKKWVFWLVLLCLVAFEAIQQLQGSEGDDLQRKSDQQQVMPGQSQNDDIMLSVAKGQIYQGDLVLVNKEYPVHDEGIEPDAVNLFEHKELVQGYGLLNNKIQLSQRIAQKFSAMIDAAREEGVSHFLISSGYRDTEEQSQLYQEKGADFALPPGYSEHNLGLSMDIGSTKGEMNHAAEGKWLKKNAWRYGFILRYPKDKTNITGIKYEPWHFRYVGLPHSVIMQEKHFTLEEYLEYLKEKKSIMTTVQGKKYHITYYPVKSKTIMYVPENQHYEISGNNIDGVILTVHP